MPSPAPLPTVSGCPAVARCTLSASQPQNNGDLQAALDAAEADWARCAAQVDIIADHQERAP
ncbi:Rz1-like lysis system protein LysC [Pseudomonas sp. RIT-PI-S]|uniref:Rz1-like lysis system protein LysC n=1 Tax=Pseudomonas sp. RIT-PI-S TaxID=3035295 RepID=UPI0021D988A0|nr:Rz1-like lysis system protein LysC [Pseudomonas sp. RIT-PI-S]